MVGFSRLCGALSKEKCAKSAGFQALSGITTACMDRRAATQTARPRAAAPNGSVVRVNRRFMCK
jgi:hypothetical protein